MRVASNDAPQTMHASNHENRRKFQRHYLSANIRAEVVFGRQRIGVESSRICDVSDHGVGLRATQFVPLKPGTAVTLATNLADRVLTIHGRVAYSRFGRDLGIEVEDSAARAELGRFADSVDTVTVGGIDGARTQVAGKISMAARHPVAWALRGGASRLDLARATDIDSSGLGLLLLLNERDGVQVENCATQVCRLVDLARLGRICAPDCPKR